MTCLYTQDYITDLVDDKRLWRHSLTV